MKNFFLIIAILAVGIARAQTPVINDFTPKTGYVNTTVHIVGSGFTGATAVTFGGIVSGPFSVINDNLIIARVSTKGASGRVGIIKAASLGGSGFSTPTLTFTLLQPVILRFSPTTCGRVGDDIVVIGRGIYGIQQVRIGTMVVPANFIQQLGDTGIKFKIPAGFVSGQICIVLDLANVCAGPICIGQPCPFIAGVTPAAARPGGYITLQGTGFNTLSLVTIGGVNASYTRRSDNELLVLVPYGAANGTIAIYKTGCPPSTFALTLLGFADNNFRWLHGVPLAGAGTQEIIGLFTEASGSTVVVGNFTGTLALPGLSALISSGASDIFYVRFNNGGVPLSAYRYGGPGDDRISDADMKSSVEMYLAGTTTISFSLPINVGVGSVVVGGSGSGEPRAFVLKITPDGRGFWSNNLSTGDDRSFEKLHISYSNGFVFVAAVAADAPFTITGFPINAKGNVYATGLSDLTGAQNVNNVPLGYANETMTDADIFADETSVYLLTHEQFVAGPKQAVFRRLDRGSLMTNYTRMSSQVLSFEALPHVKAKADTVYVGTSFKPLVSGLYSFLTPDPGSLAGQTRSNFIKANRTNPDIVYGMLANNYALTGMTVDMAARPTLAYSFTGVATIGGRTLASRGGLDIAFTRYVNSLVGPIWATQAGSNGDDHATLLDVDARNNLYTAIHALGTPLQLGVSGTLLSTSGAEWYVARFGNTSADGRDGIDEQQVPSTSSGSALSLKMYPNPIAEGRILTLETKDLAAGLAKVLLIDATGKVIHTHTTDVAEGHLEVTMPDVRPGIYQVILRQDKTTARGRLIVR